MRFGKRQVAVFLSLVAFGVLGTSASANADTGKDGFTILHAVYEDFAHKCTIIGQNGAYQAVVCVDITTDDEASEYYAGGQIEAYCQKVSGSTVTVVQCAQVYVSGELANGKAGGIYVWYACGHEYGACSSGRNYVSTATQYQYDASAAAGCAADPNSTNVLWMVAQGNGTQVTPETQIELPVSDQWTYLSTSNANDGANESTGHYYICP